MSRPPACRLASLVAIVLIALASACGGTNALAGTQLDPQPAPGFSLIDQRGQPVRLSDFRSKALALTFIFTNCPDVCPLLTQRLQAGYARLPQNLRDDVALLAVTVDPEHDTPAALQAFSEKMGLGDDEPWFALSGERAELERVWRDYGIYTSAAASTTTTEQHEHGAVEVAHTDAIFFVDPEGRRRALLRAENADPAAIARNLTQLVREK